MQMASYVSWTFRDQTHIFNLMDKFCCPIDLVGGGFKEFLNFTPHLGKIPALTNIFQRGWNHQPASVV